MTFLRYTPSVEEIGNDEVQIFQKIADTFSEMGKAVKKENGRAVRVSHAKATGLLTGELIVEEGLPTELSQGLAAKPDCYDVLVRFAQGPGEVLDDKISTHRGLAIKVLNVPGERIPEGADENSQDFVLEGTGKAFINANAKTFLANLKAGVSHAPSLSQVVKGAVSKIARGTEAVLESVGLKSPTLGFFGHPSTHPLAEPYFSQAPMRWGDYIGKVGVFPTEATIASLAEVKVDASHDHDAFRSAMQDHFASADAEFELRIQLATDLQHTPIEDASCEWPEKENPYRTVARLILREQPAWSAERDAYFARLSFRPAHSISAHQPLGQVMRARLYAYSQLVKFRQTENGEMPAAPQVSDVPT